MKLFRKFSLIAILICLGLIAGLTTSYSQEKYPSRAIELVIGWAPGGPADVLGRLYANELNKVLKVPITPVNKTGASGTIGATYTVKARKDGYTVMIGSTGWLLGSITLEDIAYDPLKDFIPIVKIGVTPHGLFVKTDSPFKSLEDLVDRAKKNPRALSCGTAGTSSDGHFNLETLQKAAGIEIKHVPFKGVGEVPPAVLGGHVDAGIGVMTAPLPFVRAGNVRILAITGDSRMKDIPNVPTFKEKGYTQTFLNNWIGLFVPAGVPQNVVDTLISASDNVMKSKDFIASVEKAGSIVEHISPADYLKALEIERKTIDTIAREVGLKKGK